MPGSPEHGRLLIGVVRSGSGNFGGSGQLESAEGTAMLVQAVEAVQGLRRHPRTRSRPDDAVPIPLVPRRYRRSREAPLSEAIAVLETLPVSHELADAYAEIAGRDLMAGRMLERTRSRRPGPGARGRCRGQGCLCACACSSGVRSGSPSTATTSAAWRDLRQALVLALETGELGVIEPSYDNLADFLHDVEGPEAGYAMYREGIEFIQGRGGAARWEQGESTWPLYVLGRWDEVLRVADGVARRGRSIGYEQPVDRSRASGSGAHPCLPGTTEGGSSAHRPVSAASARDPRSADPGAVPRRRRSGRSRLWRSRCCPGTDARARDHAKLVGHPLLGAARGCTCPDRGRRHRARRVDSSSAMAPSR